MGRTLINDLAPLMPNTELLLYAPDAGRDDLRNQIEQRENVHFCYPDHLHFRLQRDLWRMKGIGEGPSARWCRAVSWTLW